MIVYFVSECTVFLCLYVILHVETIGQCQVSFSIMLFFVTRSLIEPGF